MIVLIVAAFISSVSFASTKSVVSMIGSEDAIVSAIDHDQDINVRDWLKKGNSSSSIINNKIKESLLERSASMGSEKVFELLLSDLELKDSKLLNLTRDKRGTPILLSLVSLATPGNLNVKKYVHMIQMFLEKHSDQINLQDKAYIGDGRTALHQAAVSGNIEILKILLSHGAQTNCVNSISETPLHFAARFGQMAALKILIAHGAKLNEKSKHTQATPLLLAAESGHEAIIRTLLDSGAKKELRDVFGKTAPERFKDYVINYHRTASIHN